MKTSFANFWRRNLGCARLAVLSQLEYRFNFLADAVLQPVLVALVEVAIWSAIITASGGVSFGGFTRESYIAYALWAAFFSRVGSNWMYEMRMVNEVDSGSVNSVLVRPISFFEYYLSQFLGYKILTTLVSMIVPLTVTLWIDGPTIHSRLPVAFALQLLYLTLVHAVSFSVASLSFFLTRVHGITVAKNIALVVLTGELFPLDLVPEPYRAWAILQPFANSVFVPVGYLTGRLEIDAVWRGVGSILVSLALVSVIASMLWNAGRRRYSGTGA